MASMKVRSRRDGSAIPLDDTDKQLLNLMQGQFALVRRVKDETGAPVAAYHVSGEYSMLKAAAGNGWIDEQAAVLETLTSIRRAGADVVITYYAKEAAGWLA